MSCRPIRGATGAPWTSSSRRSDNLAPRSVQEFSSQRERHHNIREHSMTQLMRTTGAACALAIVGLVGVATAQTPAPPPQAATGPAVASPTYTSIPLEIAVNKPAADVWKRVGKFCDIGEWLQIPCTITSGKDGEFGAVRSVANEVLVGKTELSYTYTQPVREGRPYNLYHGTLEARPVSATTSKIVSTLCFDNSLIGDAAAKEADRARRAAQFTRALQNMKTLAEGGTLPPPPSRGR